MSFDWALHHLGTLENEGMALPTPDQGLQVALLSWANVTQCTRVSSHAYSQVYIRFLYDAGLRNFDRGRNDSPETFFLDLTPDPRKFFAIKIE